MEKEKTIEVLNSLITINNDRIEGYDTAAGETEVQDLKNLFAQFASTSRQCNAALHAEVLKLDGKAAEGTKTTGKFFRVWMEVKAALTGNDRGYILNSCEYGESIALSTYEKALENEDNCLNSEQQTMIRNQYTLLKADHDIVKTMSESWESA